MRDHKVGGFIDNHRQNSQKEVVEEQAVLSFKSLYLECPGLKEIKLKP